MSDTEDLAHPGTQQAAGEISKQDDEFGSQRSSTVMDDTSPTLERDLAAVASSDIDLDQLNDNYPDFDDNLSLEVNFGDGSSCRASDVSSLSFQNVVLDDVDPDSGDLEPPQGRTASRRDSEDSSDSVPEFPSESDSQAFSGALQAEVNRQKGTGRGQSPGRMSEGDEDCVDPDDPYNTGTMKRRSKLSTGSASPGGSMETGSDRGGNGEPQTNSNKNVTQTCSGNHGCPATGAAAMEQSEGEDGATHPETQTEETGGAVNEAGDRSSLPHSEPVSVPQSSALANVVLSSGSPAVAAVTLVEHHTHVSVKKRNTAEIRNNIPNVNEIKSYESDCNMDSTRYQAQGAVPKIRKKSPGLARRLEEDEDPRELRDTSSSEKETDQKVQFDPTVISAQQQFEHQLATQLRYGNLGNQTLQTLNNSEQKENLETNGTDKKSVDIENEYDYVKYARIQTGDSYVGMRLAYSSSNDSLNLNKRGPFNSGMHSDNDPYLGSSREGSPEKIMHQRHNKLSDQIRAATKVNEETLTEIPLNGNDGVSSEEQKNFSLSPEATECDSAEVESVISDEGKSETSGMPMVEDGLSSSQGSDAEDGSTMDSHRPTEILKRRYKNDIDAELGSNGIQVNTDVHMRSPSATSSSSRQSSEGKKEVDQAIQDIKTAIERSKNMMLKSPTGRPGSPHHQEQEPVWVMRDSYVQKLQRQEEMRRVREEIERQQEEEYKRKEREHVYQAEKEEDGLLHGQYTRNDGKPFQPTREYDTDEETDELLDKQYHHNEKIDIPELATSPVNRTSEAEKRRSRAKQGEQESLELRDIDGNTVLIEGVLFRARYLGSTQLISEGQPSKAMRMMQAQEAVGRIKAPEGENQPSTEVDLFVSTEKIMVLNTDLQEIMMDHALRTISYIADIGEIVVIMARRRTILSPGDEVLRRKKQSKILCHVFESDEAQLIAQSIGQAFQVAYMEFLKANGIDDPGLMKEMDYQEVLNQQEIFGEELHLFSNKEMQKEVIVPKLKAEALGVVIVESGWGSMVPTVVLANMSPNGAAARCGQLNIGDQIMSINGISLVGLPLSSCQTYIKAAKNQTVVKLTVVSCPPVVEVLIKRPDVKYQLGFSVQNGVICSLLRGGIAERGGVRVGHRIIEINGQSVVAVPHEKIVNMLATSVGEICMKTMPTSIFRLLTGQENPNYI